ncbi:glycosyltransferase family 2 protein [Patescibacteria group bacterium]|nr:glycosyltransferase family 2 protein [Patescibacteria group bacterium]
MDVQRKNKLRSEIGIVILNWNNYRDTQECLRSVDKQTYKNYQVAIVDGNSTDNSTRKLQQEFPQFKYIYSSADSGYSGGNNLGISYVLGNKVKYVLSINNDVVLDKSCLKELVKELNNNSKAGIVGPRMYSYSEKSIFQLSGGYVNVFRSKPLPKWIKENESSSKKPFEVIKLPGACIMIRSKIIRSLGMFDEGFFLYYADTDFQKRISDKGWLQISTPTAKAYHKVSATIKGGSSKMLYYGSRDFLFYIKKHYNIFILSYCFVKSWLEKSYHILVKDNDRINNLIFLNKAYLHFLLGIRGKKI